MIVSTLQLNDMGRRMFDDNKIQRRQRLVQGDVAVKLENLMRGVRRRYECGEFDWTAVAGQGRVPGVARAAAIGGLTKATSP